MIKRNTVPMQKIRSQERGIKNPKSLAERSRKFSRGLIEKVPEGELAELLARKKKRKRTRNGTDPTEQLLDDHSDALNARRGTPNPLTYTQILEALLQGVPANTEQRNDGEGVGVPPVGNTSKLQRTDNNVSDVLYEGGPTEQSEEQPQEKEPRKRRKRCSDDDIRTERQPAIAERWCPIRRGDMVRLTDEELDEILRTRILREESARREKSASSSRKHASRNPVTIDAADVLSAIQQLGERAVEPGSPVGDTSELQCTDYNVSDFLYEGGPTEQSEEQPQEKARSKRRVRFSDDDTPIGRPEERQQEPTTHIRVNRLIGNTHNEPFLRTPEDTWGPRVKLRHQLRELSRVCVFMTQWIPLKHFWALLRNVWQRIKTPICFPVEKAIIIRGPHEKVRVDLYLRKGTDGKVVAKLLKNAAIVWNLHWYVKIHVSWRTRNPLLVAPTANNNSDTPGTGHPGDGPHNTVNNAGVPDQPIGDTTAISEPTATAAVTTQLTMSTLNVNHARNKHYDIERYLTKVPVLCIQETHMRPEDGFPLHFRKNQIFTTPAKKNTPGVVGMSVIVSNDYPAQILTKVKSDFVLAVRLTLPDGVWVVVNTYIPGAPSSTRKRALKELTQVLGQLSREYPHTPISCMGDFNSKPEKLALFLSRQSLPFGIREFTGNAITHFRAGKLKSTLDYIIVNKEALEQTSKAKVNRNISFSDHWAVETRVRVNQPQTGDTSDPKFIDPKRIEQKRSDIRNNSAWDEVADVILRVNRLDSIHQDAADVVGRTCDKCTEQVASECKLYKTKVIIKGNLCKLNARTKYLVAERQRKFKAWIDGIHLPPGVRYQLYQRFIAAKDLAKIGLKNCRIHAWQKHVATTMGKLVRQSDLRTAWRWSNRLLGRDQRDAVEAPLWNTDKTSLLTRPTQIQTRLAEHFETLLDDPDGYSANKEYWAEVFPLPEIPKEELNINQDISWVELNRWLNKIRCGKAAGIDGTTNEFLKCAAENYKRADPKYHKPQCKQGKCILGIVNILFNSGVIPDAWNISVITAIYKGKWDKSDVVNYRGISVTPTMLNLVSKIVAERLYLALENANYFSVSQAGFRNLEECPTHTIALYEIIKRRWNNGELTFVAFLDIMKAYDNVCHEGILRKLETIGVTGKALRYIRGLYTNAKACVKTSAGLSYVFSLLKGLRQGCPLSCVLFNIFINSILEESERNNKGAVIPGAELLRIAGILFADDTALISGSMAHLKESIAYVVKALDHLRLTLGLKKCAILGFGDGAPAIAKAHDPPIEYRGEKVPIESEYIHLGTLIDDQLNLQRMAEARAKKGRTILAMISPVIRCDSIPLQYRIRMVKLLLGPSLTWGAEVWGCNLPNMKSCVKVWGDAALTLVRLGMHNTTVTRECVGMELGMHTLQGMIITSRARVLWKIDALKTVVNLLSRNPASNRKLAWFSAARKWFLGRYPDVLNPDNMRLNAMLTKMSLNHLRDDIDLWICRQDHPVSMQRYLNLDLSSTRKWHSYTNRLPYDAIGLNWFARLRIGSIYTVDVLCRMPYSNPTRWKSHCPFCDAEGKENIFHLLFHCTHWAGQRATYLDPLLDRHTKFGGPTVAQLTDQEHLCFLIGGRTTVPDGLSPDDLELDGSLRTLALCNEPDFWSNQPALIDRVNTRSLDAYGNVRILFEPTPSESGRVSCTDIPVFILVARFLSSVMPVRRSIMDAQKLQEPLPEP